MTEYLTEAVVLDKEMSGDADVRVSLFTKKFGKLKAKAKSARRIVSKLSGHVEPGHVVQARLIEKNGLQIVDALKLSHLNKPPSDFYFLNQLLADFEPDMRLWHVIVSGRNLDSRFHGNDIGEEVYGMKFNWIRILGILGWDPEHGVCVLCGAGDPGCFDVSRQDFYCEGCASRFAQNTVLSIDSPRDNHER